MSEPHTSQTETLANTVAAPPPGSTRRLSAGHERLGAYRLTNLLGEGGMGEVHRAERVDGEFEQTVAVKLIKAGHDEELIAGFRRERNILAGLNHPNIARLFDGGATPHGLPYFVMEYVEQGMPLTEYCDTHRLGLRSRLRLFLDAARAVAYAHQRLIVHLDIKPGNILVTGDGIPKLLDFGIAKLLDTEGGMGEGPGVMTLFYASPEQVAGQGVTTSSDVYSLGVVLFELLTGHRPYRNVRSDDTALRQEICYDAPPRPSQVDDSYLPASHLLYHEPADGPLRVNLPPREGRRIRQRLRGDLDALLRGAMAKSVEARYGSVEQFADDIAHYLGGKPLRVREGNPLYRWGKFLRRNLWRVIAVVTVILFSVALAVTSSIQSQRIAQQRDEARRARVAAEAAQQVAERERDRANRARQAAQEALVRVTRERNKATEVSRFLVDLFQVADPERNLGADIPARVILDRGAEQIPQRLENQPLVRASLLDVMGRVYQGLGLYSKAQTMLASGLAIRARELKPGHPEYGDLADSHLHFGIVQRTRGAYSAARHHLDRAYTLRTRLHGADAPAVAEVLKEQAWLDLDTGHTAAAARGYRQALARYPEDSGYAAERAAILNDLATLYHQTGDFAEAETRYRQARSTLVRRYGETHPAVARIELSRAKLNREQDRLETAEEALSTASQGFEAIYDPEHPVFTELTLERATLRLAQGRLGAAREAYEAARLAYRERLGPNHPAIATILEGLARVAHRRGELETSATHYRDAIEHRKMHLDPAHPEVATAYLQLGMVQHDAQHRAAARSAYTQAATCCRQPQAQTLRADAYHNLGVLEYEAGRFEAAREALKQAIEHRRSEDSANRLAQADSLLLLGLIEQRTQAFAAAKAAYQRARAIKEGLLGPDDPAVKRIGALQDTLERQRTTLDGLFNADPTPDTGPDTGVTDNTTD